MTPKQKLYQAAKDCDNVLVQYEVDNDAERVDHRKDERRLERYRRRRNQMLDLRKALENLYVELYNENPWEKVSL